MLSIRLCLPVALLFLSVIAPATTLASAPANYETRLIALAQQADDTERPVAEQPLLLRLLDDPQFARLLPETRAYALAVAGANALKLDQPDQALPLLVRACDLNPDKAIYWYQRSIAERFTSQWDAAAHSMTRYARLAPDEIADIAEDVLGPLLINVTPDSAQRRELLQVLFDAHWTYAATDPSDQWYALAMLKYEAGETDSIAPVLDRIRTPYGMVRLRADRRFDVWIDRAAKRWNVTRAAQNELDDLRVRSLLDPDDMKIMAALAEQLTALEQDEEVVRMTDQVSAIVGNYQIDHPHGDGPYKHMEDYAWLLEQRAYALENLDRDDEALTLRRALVDFPQADGSPDISYRLGLARMLAVDRQPQDALALLADVQADTLSSFGMMSLHRTRMFAAEQLHDAVGVAQELEYLRTHTQDAPTLYLEALLYLDRADEAAAFVRRELAAPARRGDMLYYVQNWPTYEVKPGEVDVDERLHAVLERPDVHQAIDAVGRRESYEFNY